MNESLEIYYHEDSFTCYYRYYQNHRFVDDWYIIDNTFGLFGSKPNKLSIPRINELYWGEYNEIINRTKKTLLDPLELAEFTQNKAVIDKYVRPVKTSEWQSKGCGWKSRTLTI